MKLGILYKNGKIVNHRSLVKVLFNPILRYLGYYISSICINEKVKGIKLMKGQKTNRIIYHFKNYNEYDLIIKKRLII